MIKIGAYVFNGTAKANYKNESFDTRMFVGLMVVKDIIERQGFKVEYCSSYIVNNYDLILVSLTSDCDFWTFIEERTQWKKGKYKIAVGGAGVLNVRPFLEYADFWMLGRAEGEIEKLIKDIENYESESTINSKTFSIDKKYYINQVEKPYENEIILGNGKSYKEAMIGCNHKCHFCGYTWHRKHCGLEQFQYTDLWNKQEDTELAILDMAAGKKVNYQKLRTTAIDGMSERLRFSVNKKITNNMIIEMFLHLAKCEKPHQTKFYNIVGLPTETEKDWFEFLECLINADKELAKSEKQACILLHNTPFRPMPATPMACKEMSYKNYRGLAGSLLGKGLKGNIIFQGNGLWSVESMGTESLCTVIQSAIVWRGTEKDSNNIRLLACNKKFKSSSSQIKQATLEKYFDVKTLFGKYTTETLPTRYLMTYASVEKRWNHG